MHRLLTGQGVITEVVAAMPRRDGEQTRAAIAYLTVDHLGLTTGDVLVVNASKGAVQGGATDPRLLGKLIGAGVLLFNLGDLHAKVIERGDRVAVGSANSSRKTLDLFEATWVSDHPELTTPARAWLDSVIQSATPLTLADLDRLQPLWRTKVGAGPEPSARARKTPNRLYTRSKVPGLWLWRPAPGHPRIPPAPSSLQVPTPPNAALEVIPNDDQQVPTQRGDIWVRWSHGWLESPRVVLQPRYTVAGYPGTFTVVMYDPAQRSLRPTDEFKATYDAAVRASDMWLRQSPARELLRRF